MNNIELAAELEHALQVARADLGHRHPDIEPELMRDMSGRYLLLDAIAALAQLRAALTK